MSNLDFSTLEPNELINRLPESSKQHKRVFFASIAVVVFVLFAVFVWWDQVKQAQSIEIMTQEKLSLLESQASVIAERVALERELVELRQKIPEIIAGFPAEEEVAQLLDSMYRKLGTNGLYLAEFKPMPNEKVDELSKLPVKVLVEGGAAQIVGIPNLLASLSRKVNLAQYLILKKQDDDRWVLEGQIDAYAKLIIQPAGALPVSVVQNNEIDTSEAEQ